MFGLDADEHEEDEGMRFEFEVYGGDEHGVRAFWREARAHAEVGAVAGAPAVGRWLAWLRLMWWRVQPRLHLHRLRAHLRGLWLRFTLWWERVDRPLLARGLFACAQAFLGMMLLRLREVDYHLLPRLRYPYELPRDSYVARLQASFRFCMIESFKLLCVMRGFSGAMAALVGLGVDVGVWGGLDFYNIRQQPVPIQDQGQDQEDLPQTGIPRGGRHHTVIPLGGGHQLVIPGRPRWVLFGFAMMLMVGVVFLLTPTSP